MLIGANIFEVKSMVEKICTICGKKYNARRKTQKCCSDECRTKLRKSYMKDYGQMLRKNTIEHCFKEYHSYLETLV
jgi:hypothetical protein